jgi:parallel beta-helix repeat protein
LTATRLRNCVCTFSLLLVVAISAQAQTPITTCGTEITQPGQYFLANDLTGCSNGILIQSQGVTLKLNSHQIVGVEEGGSRGILVSTGTAPIIDGPRTIARFDVGVYLQRTTSGTLIVGLTVQDNHYGFFVTGSRESTIGGNTVATNQEGILLFNSSDNHLVENIINSNQKEGIQVNGSRNEIILNDIRNNGTYGIEVLDYFGSRNNRIANNTATGNTTFDLAERGAQVCDNIWVNNMFTTANLPCIQ